jgi:hypothetical protein
MQGITKTYRPRSVIMGLYRKMNTWQSVAALLGYTPAYWRMVAMGERKISRQADDALRWLWRMPPKYCRRVERMSGEALARYIAQRREMR